ncbi:MAG: glycoside hydrolase family 3 N-terminal domain-containing protein [Lachnospiraceae bacterium]
MADNTNLGQTKKEEQDKEALRKREERRRRRKRNQLMAYVTMIVIVLLVAAGVVSTVLYIGKLEKEKQDNTAAMAENIDNIIETEETLVKPEPTETVPELTPEEKLDEIIDAAIEVMPIEDKVAGLFIVTPESITGVNTAIKAGDGTKEALSKWAVGGLIYFEKNMKSPEQITEMISNSSLYSRYPLFICVEEEGGSVSRVAEAGLAENVGDVQTIGATADPAQAYAAGATVAGYLQGYGFNVDLAPVADINNAEGSVVGNRSYGSDSSVVASMTASMVQGLEENGVSACMKHFPGIGSCSEDANAGLAVTDRTAEQFRAEEFTVFTTGIDAGVDFIMVSNVAVPAFTGDNTPCTMSKEVVTDILREELGFNGVIISDSMNMKAITEYYEADEAAILALKAGCDMILMPDDFEKAYNGVLEAVQNGTISEERINDSLRRIYRIKYADKLAE